MPAVISSALADCSSMVAAMVWMFSATLFTRFTTSAMRMLVSSARTTRSFRIFDELAESRRALSVRLEISPMSLPTSPAALFDSSASWRTSSATTATPVRLHRPPPPPSPQPGLRRPLPPPRHWSLPPKRRRIQYSSWPSPPWPSLPRWTQLIPRRRRSCPQPWRVRPGSSLRCPASTRPPG